MSGPRVALIGANGQLGTDLVEVLDDWDVVPLTHADLDICDFVYTRKVLEGAKPDIVINTAAFVRVDDCENEVSKAFWVNAFAVRNLAKVCADLDCKLVHISTDYVFDGSKTEPYTEEDLPNPLNVYGASKLAGEHFVQAICENHLIIRTSGLYGKAGSSGKGGNFVETMIWLAQKGSPVQVVDDQQVSPTCTRDLAFLIENLVRVDMGGLFHAASAGHCSWFQFATRICELAGLNGNPVRTTSASFGNKTHRPPFSALGHARLEATGFAPMRSWEQQLESYISPRCT